MWNEGDPEEQDIELAGMQETHMNRTLSWLECRRPREDLLEAGRNEEDPKE